MAAAYRRQGPVALPAYSCFDVATAAIGAGIEIAWYDLDPHTLGPDLISLEQALRHGAKGVVVVHLYGIPSDMASVAKLCDEHGAILIEDAAQGFGGFFRGRRLGAIGSLGILSFGRGKGVTGGAGGCLLGNDELGTEIVGQIANQLPARRRGWRVLARAQLQWLFGRPALYWLPKALPGLRLGETVFRSPWEPGSESAASLGILSVTLDLAERAVEERRARAGRLLAAIKPQLSCLTIRPAADSRPSYLRLPVLWRGNGPREAQIAMPTRLGVMPGYPKPLSALLATRSQATGPEVGLDGAAWLASSLFTLPTHGLLTERDLVRLEEWIRDLGAA
jgi:dTDP-4-amino-4,6-dideoxygalactose transaminase